LTHANSRNRFISAWNMLHQAGSFELAAYEYLRQLASGNGSTRAALTGGILRTVPVPLPSTLDEQREIVEILDALDRRISLHQRKRIVLEELFKALLHKLMTGEIRVADLDRSVFGNTSAAPSTQLLPAAPTPPSRAGWSGTRRDRARRSPCSPPRS
jgi:hypothetical protein